MIFKSATERVDVGGVHVDPVTASEVVDRVDSAWSQGLGGTIVTPNVDIWRTTRRDSSSARLVNHASIVVADGQPLVWAARLAGTPLPGRVTGSSLVEKLSARAAERGRSVFVLGGGADNTADLAVDALMSRYPALRVVGTVVPPFGFEAAEESYGALVEKVTTSNADLVFVGLGFPKQDRLAADLQERMPQTWFLGCGGGLAMAGGLQRRSPAWAQRLGVEWVVRLLQEPRRLARRYLIDDIPAGLQLIGLSLRARLSRHRG